MHTLRSAPLQSSTISILQRQTLKLVERKPGRNQHHTDSGGLAQGHGSIREEGVGGRARSACYSSWRGSHEQPGRRRHLWAKQKEKLVKSPAQAAGVPQVSTCEQHLCSVLLAEAQIWQTGQAGQCAHRPLPHCGNHWDLSLFKMSVIMGRFGTCLVQALGQAHALEFGHEGPVQAGL